jgi:hypothetical protein
MVPRTVFQSNGTQSGSDSGTVKVTENPSISRRWASLVNDFDDKYIGEKATVKYGDHQRGELEVHSLGNQR